jgi:hypothetical protein
MNRNGFIIVDFLFLFEFLGTQLAAVCIYIYKVFSFKLKSITDLKSIHYAQSITVLNTLTSGTNYIQPPVIVIEYGELSLSDIGKGTIVEVRM